MRSKLTWAMAAVAFGAGVWYFLDPSRGGRRRALAAWRMNAWRPNRQHDPDGLAPLGVSPDAAAPPLGDVPVVPDAKRPKALARREDGSWWH